MGDLIAGSRDFQRQRAAERMSDNTAGAVGKRVEQRKTLADPEFDIEQRRIRLARTVAEADQVGREQVMAIGQRRHRGFKIAHD